MSKVAVRTHCPSHFTSAPAPALTPGLNPAPALTPGLTPPPAAHLLGTPTVSPSPAEELTLMRRWMEGLAGSAWFTTSSASTPVNVCVWGGLRASGGQGFGQIGTGRVADNRGDDRWKLCCYARTPWMPIAASSALIG